MKKTLLALYVLLMIFTVQAQEQEIDISGEWTITQESPRGDRSSNITIKQEGNEATVWSSEGEYIMTINNNVVSWSRTITTPMGAMAADFQGKISDSNSMSGTSSFSQGPMSGRSLNWYAKRQKTKEEIAEAKAAKKAKKKKKKAKKKKKN